MSYYDGIAPGYDALYGEEQLKKLETMWQVGQSMGLFDEVKTILDVGCGTGISSDFFAKKTFAVTGIDPAEKLLEQNKSDVSTLLHTPAETIPFDDNSFDLVISVTAIQNFDDLQRGLAEIKRVGKRFILTFLKGVQKKEIIDEAILNTFDVERIIRDEKDAYYFILKK
jgi:demethylmenaquinone methyltransferase/2-methoxy-6-polyprenyl-1,4-benzoquinol methylase